MKQQFNKDISRMTVSRRLIRAGLMAKHAAKKPLMVAKHRKLRLEFAKKYASWTPNDWANVVFTDESKVNLFQPDGNHLIRRPVGQRYNVKYLRPTVKFGGGSVMLWGKRLFFLCLLILLCLGAMTRNSPGPLVLLNSTLDARRYKNILKNHLLPFSTAKMGQGWLLYQDNAPCHKSKLLMGRVVRLANGGRARLPGWFRSNGVQLVSAPPYSPDLNVIEHLWAYVKSQLKGKRFGSKVELWYYIRNAWQQVSPQILHALVDSMPRRIQEVIKARGGPTKF